MNKADFPFEDDDIFIRRIPKEKRNKQGRPTRGAFQGPPDGTSVYLKRILAGQPVPERRLDDDLAEFPVEWIHDLSLTVTPLQVEYDPLPHEAHFNIHGQLHEEFKDYLRDNSTFIRAIDLDPVN